MKQACSVQAVSNNNSVRLAHPKFEEESTTSLSLSIQSPLDATQLERNLVMMISLKNENNFWNIGVIISVVYFGPESSKNKKNKC